MNKKLIAAAVSAAVVAPVAAQAEVSVYGRINNAIDTNDISAADDADSTTDISAVSSRFGVKYDQEIGSGYSAHGKYEFSTSSDKEEEGVADIRVATVGLSGPLGRIDVGNQWSSYFDTFGTLVSPTYSLGYYIYSSVGGGLVRSSNTIKYSNTFGPLYAELDVRLNDSDEGSDVAEKARGNGVGLGLSFSVTDNITIAVAVDNEEGVDDNAARAEVAPRARIAPTVDIAHLTANNQMGGDALVWDANGDGVADNRVATDEQVGEYAEIAVNAADMDHERFVDTDDGMAGGPTTMRDAAIAERRAEFLQGLIDAANEDRPSVGLGGDVQGEELDALDNEDLSDLVGADTVNYQPEVAARNGEVAGGNDSPDTDRFGVAIKWTGGDYWASLGFQSYEVDDDENTAVDDEIDIDTTMFYFGGNFTESTNWLLGYSVADDERDAQAAVSPVAATMTTDPVYGLPAVVATDDSSSFVWGIYHNMGGGIKVYWEGTDLDSENKEWDGARHFIGMRVDF